MSVSSIVDALKGLLQAAALVFAFLSGRKSKDNEITRKQNKSLRKHAEISARPRASIDTINKWLRGK